jgi:polyhydroxybutyrate depolymerase
MKMIQQTSCSALVLVLALVAGIGVRAADAPAHREWTVDGVVREALVYAPASAKTNATPLVFVFHGHGGNMNQVARASPIHTLWPETLVVYPQGLKTPGRLTDPEGKKNGWQHGVGAEGDRDLKFFDAMLDTLKKDFKVDEKRIYSTGHSNGGGFTYLLWAERGDRFAAFAPSSAATTPTQLPRLKPKPVMHIAGENDPLVKFAWQKLTMDAVRKLNQCDAGQPWDKVEFCTLYPSKLGAPVVTFIHPGTHTFHKDAPAAIVKFFKEQAKP